jgi:hypothetical protein
LDKLTKQKKAYLKPKLMYIKLKEKKKLKTHFASSFPS